MCCQSSDNSEIEVDPTNNFPCLGLDAATGKYFNFTSAEPIPPNNWFPFDYKGQNSQARMSFSFCGMPKVQPVCELANPPPKNLTVIGVMQVISDKDNSTDCVPLSNTNGTLANFNVSAETREASQGYLWSVQVESNLDSTVEYRPVLMLGCPENNTEYIGIYMTSSYEKRIELGIYSRSFCPWSEKKLPAFLVQYRVFSAVAGFGAVGLLVLGQVLLKTSIFLAAWNFCLLIGLQVVLVLVPRAIWKESTVYYCVSVVACFSALAALLTVKLPKLSLMVVGGFLGYTTAAKMLEVIVLFSSQSDISTGLVIMVSLSLFGAYIGIRTRDHIYIIGSSFAGSYTLSLFVGSALRNYPDFNDLKVIKELKLENKLVLWFVIYSLVWLIGGGCSAVIQYALRAARLKRREQGDSSQDDQMYYDYLEKASGAEESNPSKLNERLM